MKEGSAAALQCEGHGRPQPEVTWLKDGVELVPGSELSHTAEAAANGSVPGEFGVDGSIPVISALRPTEPGLYTCLMKNAAGYVSHNISLFVEGQYKSRIDISL